MTPNYRRLVDALKKAMETQDRTGEGATADHSVGDALKSVLVNLIEGDEQFRERVWAAMKAQQRREDSKAGH